jgi:hypothetical protein
MQNCELHSWAMERVRQYGVAGLFPGSQKDSPFILYTQSTPRPAWSGNRDFHQERLQQAYEFLIKVGAGMQPVDADGKIFDTTGTLDASGSFPACETGVCVDALLTPEADRDTLIPLHRS